MRKWILSIFCAMSILLLGIPMVANATDAWNPVQSVKIGTAELNVTTPYYHNGAEGAQGTADNVADGANATFDPATGTLTLNDLNIESSEAGIYWEYKDDGAHDLTIKVVGNNTIASQGGIAINGAAGRVTGEGPSLKITGDGTLKLDGSAHAIWVWKNIIIQEDVNITATSVGGFCICNNTPIGTVVIEGNAMVTVNGSGYGIGYGSYEWNANTPSIQGGTVIVTGGTSAFKVAPNLEENTKWLVSVGDSESDAETWDGSTGLNSYKYVKLVSNGTKTPLAGTATITGTATLGETLTADLTDTNLADNEKATLMYQWKRDGEVVGSKSANHTYTLTLDDVGKEITVEISSSLYSGSVTSAATALVESGDVPDDWNPVKIVKIGGVELNESTPYYHNGAEGAPGTADNEPAGANATFNPVTGTLILNGLNIVSGEASAKAIWWEYSITSQAKDLRIVLADGTTNTAVNSVATSVNGESGFSDGASLVIEGSGTLNVSGGTCGIWVYCDVTIQGDAKVNVTGDSKGGIYNNDSNGLITIKDNAEVTVTGDSYGIGYDNYDFNANTPLIQGGTVIASGGTGAFKVAPSLEENTKWQVSVGDSAENSQIWNGLTGLNNYKYVKLVDAGDKTALVGTATITGTAKYGETLTAVLTDLNLTTEESQTLAYQWKRDGEAVGTKTSNNTYTLTADDVGKAITVEVSTYMYSGSLISAASDVVEKADAPAAPTGLMSEKPSEQGRNDGKITGVTNAMEYSATTDFSSKTACSGTEITGLTAGTYYVRIAETVGTKAGNYAVVVVEEGPQHVHSYSTTWSYDENNHWYAATCGHDVVSGKEAHYGGTATCTTKAVCVDCGQSYGAFGVHSGNKVDGQAATETADGWKDYYQCGGCSKCFSDEGCTAEITDLAAWKVGDGKIPATGQNNPHVCNPVIVNAVSATCTTTGKDAYYHCEGCGKNYADAQGANEIPNLVTWGNTAALGHDVSAATCEEMPKCKRSGCTYTTGEALGHNFDTTWEKDEESHWYKCNNSGCTKVSGRAAHDFAWYITKDATETERGEMSGKCAVCEYTVTKETPVVEVTTGSGEVLVVSPESNANKAEITNTEAVKKSIPLTDEERNAVVGGTDLSIILETTDITATVATEEKDKLDADLSEYKAGMYMDISLWKQVGAGQKNYVSKTAEKVKISFAIPENLRAGSDVTRAYKVLKLHNGVVTAIDAVYDAASYQLTFATDEFSTYLLSYKDTENVPQPTSTPEPTNTPEPTTPPQDDEQDSEDDQGDINQPIDDEKDESPKTGDTTKTSAWLILMLLSGIGMLIAGVKWRISLKKDN